MNHALGGGITFCYDIKTDNKVMKVGGQTNNFLVISDPDQTYYIIDLWDPFFDVVRELNFKYDAYFFNEYLQTDADLWVRTHDRLEPDCNYYIFSVTGKRNVNSILEYMHMPLLEEDITVKDWYLSLSNGDLTLNNVVKDGDFEIKFTEPRDTLGFLIKIDKDIKKQMMNENN